MADTNLYRLGPHLLVTEDVLKDTINYWRNRYVNNEIGLHEFEDQIERILRKESQMPDDPQHFESVAPQEGAKIVDKNEAISNPQKRATDPKFVGAKDVRKEGVKIVTRRGTS